MNCREEALAAFAAYLSDDDWPDNIHPPIKPYLYCNARVILVPPSLLADIATSDVPAGIAIGVGNHRGNVNEIFWDGRLTRNEDGSFRSIITHEGSSGMWTEAISTRFYFDLLHKCVQSRLGNDKRSDNTRV